MNRKKQKGNIALGVIWLLVVVGLVLGWVFNVVHTATKYPPIKDWQGSQIVCTIGIFAAPVGAVCGWIDGGVVEPKPAPVTPPARPGDDLLKEPLAKG